MEHFDVFVVGGGAAGMAAALAAWEQGRSVLLADRSDRLGGVLNQCLHRGFGGNLTGPVYAQQFVRRLERSGVRVCLSATVLRLDPDRTALLSGSEGLRRVRFDRCVLAAGCRERTIESLPMAGTRPAGVFTAGTAQNLVNLGRWEIGDNIVILGSGDIGQIMARQFVQAGKRVVAVVEQNAQPGGLARNRRECLKAYRIPVLLRTTVDEILGAGRVRGVMLRDLPTGRRRELACDTLVTALGLLPDRELCRTVAADGSLPRWLRLCGNCDVVHSMVDCVVREAEALGAALWEE